MFYSQDIKSCLQGNIKNGLNQDELLTQTKPLLSHMKKLAEDYKSNVLPVLNIGERRDDLEIAIPYMKDLLEDAKTLIVLGTGGSSLGGQTLIDLEDKNDLEVLFFNNLDARLFGNALGRQDLATTRFLTISKSGNTPETLTQTIVALDYVIRAGLEEQISRIFLGISEPETEGVSNGLRDILNFYNIPVLEHDPDIGGRFSAFTIVGLLPAFAKGLDPFAFRKGAASVVKSLLEAKTAEEYAPAMGAALSVSMLKDRNVQASVMMPYSGQLDNFTHWYTQLWAESLGKEGKGTIPMSAVGPQDQHSMLQLLLDGPRLFLMNLVRVKNADKGPRIKNSLATLAGADFLAGKTIGELVNAQQKAIHDSFVKTDRPVRVIELETLNEESMGALMMHFMIETILTARLLNINPFDQPAVELGKVLTRKYLAREQKTPVKRKYRIMLTRHIKNVAQVRAESSAMFYKTQKFGKVYTNKTYNRAGSSGASSF